MLGRTGLPQCVYQRQRLQACICGPPYSRPLIPANVQFWRQIIQKVSAAVLQCAGRLDDERKWSEMFVTSHNVHVVYVCEKPVWALFILSLNSLSCMLTVIILRVYKIVSLQSAGCRRQLRPVDRWRVRWQADWHCSDTVYPRPPAHALLWQLEI